MFQKNFQEPTPRQPPQSEPPEKGASATGKASAHRTNSNKLKQQRNDRIDQRSRKHPLRRLIPMRVDINGKKRNIQHQTRHRDRRDLRLVILDKFQEILKGKSRVELDEIVDDKAYDRCD
jgi:hypothetical protein